MKVFVSYGHALDQVTALRLQALGAVNGLTVYVPPANTRSLTGITAESQQKISECDVVLGIVRAGVTPACLAELNAGAGLLKTQLIMTAPELAMQFPDPTGLVVVDPRHPERSENEIVARLKGIQQGSRNAMLALGTLALALLMFASAAKE